jgi:hypothetical protein
MGFEVGIGEGVFGTVDLDYADRGTSVRRSILNMPFSDP